LWVQPPPRVPAFFNIFTLSVHFQIYRSISKAERAHNTQSYSVTVNDLMVARHRTGKWPRCAHVLRGDCELRNMVFQPTLVCRKFLIPRII
jgi:hypothetical protein